MSETGERVRPTPRGGESARVAVEELERRAVAAWDELVGAQREPLEIEVLQHERRRSVLRLRPGDGARACGAPAIIAKRCPISVALKERAIYAAVLPRL